MHPFTSMMATSKATSVSTCANGSGGDWAGGAASAIRRDLRMSAHVTGTAASRSTTMTGKAFMVMEGA